MIVRLIVFLLCAIHVGIASADSVKMTTAHDFSFKTIDGRDLPLTSFKGKALMIVNTASKCGFTKQYSALQELWNRYQDLGLVVLGVPSNDFGHQEPGSEAQIKEFCRVNFNINFPMTEKVQVEGETAHPFFVWAGKQVGLVGKPRWNFHKYVIDGEGKLIDWFSSPTSPVSNKVIKVIETVLPPSK